MFSRLEGFVGEFCIGFGSEYRVDGTGDLLSDRSQDKMQEPAYLLGENDDMCHDTFVEHFRTKLMTSINR